MAQEEISYRRVLEDDKKMDVEYKNYLLNILVERERMESNKKPRNKDEENDSNCDHEEEIDPQYQLFLKNLKRHDKSYIVEDEENSSPVFLQYEMDEPCDLEPRRESSASMKQQNPPLDQMPGVEYEDKIEKEETVGDFDYNTYLKSLRMQKQKKMVGVKYQRAKEDDYDYITYLGSVKVVNDRHVLKYGGLTVMCEPKSEKTNHENEDSDDADEEFLGYTSDKEGNHRVLKYEGHKAVYEPKDEKNNDENEDNDDESFSDEDSLDYTSDKEEKMDFSMVPLKDGENNQVKEEYSDGYPDVEILDSPFDEMKGSLRIKDSTRRRESKFRQKVMTVLSKPYDKQEYNRLWKDVKHRKPKERHLDLRNGRERSYTVEQDGKSYLDHYPGLEIKILQVQGDKQKRLNLLRGFFFWLKYLQRPGSFRPWEDDECLAITPKSS